MGGPERRNSVQSRGDANEQHTLGSSKMGGGGPSAADKPVGGVFGATAEVGGHGKRVLGRSKVREAKNITITKT